MVGKASIAGNKRTIWVADAARADMPATDAAAVRAAPRARTPVRAREEAMLVCKESRGIEFGRGGNFAPRPKNSR